MRWGLIPALERGATWEVAGSDAAEGVRRGGLPDPALGRGASLGVVESSHLFVVSQGAIIVGCEERGGEHERTWAGLAGAGEESATGALGSATEVKRPPRAGGHGRRCWRR